MGFARFMSRLATLARMGAGRSINPSLGPRPVERLIVYEFEGCPYCRRVREAITDLDLTVEIRPCPKDGRRFRPGIKDRAANATFPFLIDPNHDLEMFGSREIVAHLYAKYGAGKPPRRLTSPLFVPSSVLAMTLRGVAGAWRRASYVPDEPLQFEGFEGDPEARLVRERLCELELPYVLKNGETVRLADPSTAVTLEGYEAILAYLDESWDSSSQKRLTS